MSQPAGIWAMKVGDKTAQDFSALGLQAAADYMGGTGGGRILFAGRITGFTNLTLYANTTLEGLGMNASEIVRDPAATGIAIREKTTGEGNGASGATGIWLRDFKLTGNATGDGINLGNQGAAQLNINAGLDHVFVNAFSGGYGMILNGNAARCSMIWANQNKYGIQFAGGGANKWFDVKAENNTSNNILIQDHWNTFYSMHCEEGANAGSSGTVEVSGSNNTIYGLSVALSFNRNNIFVQKAGASKNSVFDFNLLANGHTFANMVYDESHAWGNGSVDDFLPFWIDQNTRSSYFFDSSTGNVLKITGGLLPYQPAADGNHPSTGSTISINTGLRIRVNGNGSIDTVNPVTPGLIVFQCDANPTFKNGTGNMILNGDFVGTPNSTLTLLGDTTQSKWIEMGRCTL